jgi:hypothetical protein
MAEFDALPPDQRAAVELLLRQRRSYDELADLLGVDAHAVRARAHSALEALGPETGPALDPRRRAQIADYLLGQQGLDERAETRDFLAESPGARAWARAVAGVLRPIAPDAVPEVSMPAPARQPEVEEERAPYAAAPGMQERASRLGGALLLGGAAIVVAVVVILLVGGGGEEERDTSTVSTTPTNPPATQPQTSPQPVAQFNLTPPGGGTRPLGLAQVFRRGEDRAVLIAAQSLRPGAYALWLYNSGRDARLLGFVPQRVTRAGRFATQGVLPRDAGRYRFLVVTMERVTRRTRRSPTRPGRIVLRGRMSLG